MFARSGPSSFRKERGGRSGHLIFHHRSPTPPAALPSGASRSAPPGPAAPSLPGALSSPGAPRRPLLPRADRLRPTSLARIRSPLPHAASPPLFFRFAARRRSPRRLARPQQTLLPQPPLFALSLLRMSHHYDMIHTQKPLLTLQRGVRESSPAKLKSRAFNLALGC
ncbi:oleosin-B6-like [Varanus komodoensis]|uniref:oleosin-B6-like n=1 Tax=Varanus komodoensis TaxID=61221 RepID=UPI001CF768CA|nr:oleosin-B6-like [Varanus komodoensis]XP_044303403.1 oleosin-B6-like [Varanus komodoensis]